MAITLDRLVSLLEEIGIKKYDRRDEEIVFAVQTGTYRDQQGRDAVLLVARLDENGEYFRVFAPVAFTAAAEHRDAFLQACMVLQWRTKLVQFEFDESDGEIRPVIEFPLEDNDLTAAQLARCVGGMCGILDSAYAVLDAANRTGTIDFSHMESAEREHLQRMAEQIRKRLEELGGGNGPAPTSL